MVRLLLQPTASRRDALRALTGLGLLGGGLWLGASTPLGDSLLADLSTGRGQRQDFNLGDGKPQLYEFLVEDFLPERMASIQHVPCGLARSASRKPEPPGPDKENTDGQFNDYRCWFGF